MTLPTLNDIQAVEPVLQNLLVGYMNDASAFVASRVFPVVPTDKDSGTYYILSKKYWMRDQQEERAPGNAFARAGFGVETATFTTLQWGLEQVIPDEHRKNSQLPMDLERLAVELLGESNLIRLERAFAADFMVTSVWATDNSSNTDWDDFSAGDPVNDIKTAKRTIHQSTAKKANTIVMGEIVHDALTNHPDIIDRIKYTAAATQGNIETALAALFGLDNYHVGGAVYNSANESVTATVTPVIDDDALVCYVDPRPSLFSATAGMTFAWDGGGGIGTMDAYREDKVKSDVVRIQSQWDQKAVATDLGYFFSDVV